MVRDFKDMGGCVWKKAVGESQPCSLPVMLYSYAECNFPLYPVLLYTYGNIDVANNEVLLIKSSSHFSS